MPTWKQIYAMLPNQAEKNHQSDFEPNVIVGVKRGGFAPARVLADVLETTDVATVGIEFYVGITEIRHELFLMQRVSADVEGKRALLIDDNAETGKSLRLFREHLRQQGATEIGVATMYSKPSSAIKPDYNEKKTQRWVVFPWDAKETARKIVEKHRDERAIAIKTARLMKASLSKQLIEKFMKEAFEAGNC